jgi:hypothetical protein
VGSFMWALTAVSSGQEVGKVLDRHLFRAR